MENKELTPQESMTLIARMIEASKQRVAMPDLRISVMWAVLSIVTAAVVLTVSMIRYTPWINLVWFAIPVIGIPLNIMLSPKTGIQTGTKTFLDTVCAGIWKTVGFIAIFLTIICGIFQITGYSQAWLAMLYYAFIIVGFAAAMTGIVLRENSYVVGGVFSIIAGFTVIALQLCNIPLLVVWVIPLYMFCFLIMFIVPAFMIRRKFNDRKR